ncbi:two component transcriptional regulator, LuxR family [Pseudomonas sp. ok272]|uniref:response regulator transcription factor n=1 Tax=unclassified Pseudomonas TaxID=196821 RepID=UPI0008D244A2|nr:MULTISPECIES: response regulator transcription factor [unclassified Pseudomonas]SEM69634.1 two component transcriptional regulator, LuxR family [Pseudomonas sp. ok272]SFM58325.1 two component transcriptional regulator, LuxR family [Pseudomonas sp. ok602]
MSSVLIADDHPVVRAALKMVLGALKDSNDRKVFDTLFEVSDGVSALQLIRERSPSLVVLDLQMPKLGGLEFLARLQHDRSPARVVVFSSYEPRFYVERCMRAGAMGFVEKTNDLEELVKAVKALLSGYTYFPRLDTSTVNLSVLQIDEQKMIEMLSDRELTIFQYLARGAGNQEIATMMNLSHKTISTYKSRLIDKLNVKSLVHLRDLAQRNQLI